MKRKLDDSKPLFLQIKDRIEDQIVNRQLKEHEQIPSTTQLVNFYKVNHLTVAKGVNLLVEEGIVYKKRGVGMFVAEGAREKLLKQRRERFVDEYVVPLVEEAGKLGISDEEIFQLIKEIKGSEKDV
ncbi:MAG: GntR family transcriptional regulator [Bacillales bacterium]